MTDVVQYIFWLWAFSEVYFFSKRASKTSADLGFKGEELRTLSERRREFNEAQSAALTAEREWQKIQPAIAQTRRRKDGKFDERSKLGKMLNREVPRIRRVKKRAGKERVVAKKKLATIESLPERRMRGWARAASLRAACRQGMVILPIFVLLSANAEHLLPGESIEFVVILWFLGVGLLTLGYSSSTLKKLNP